MRPLLSICVLSLLCACGGGGSGDSAHTPAPPVASKLSFQFKNAWADYMQREATWPVTLTGTASNPRFGSFTLSGTGTVSQTWERITLQLNPFLADTTPAIVVHRTYDLTAQVAGVTLTKVFSDNNSYDPDSFSYIGGLLNDSSINNGSGNTSYPSQQILPPTTLQCCNANNISFYQTRNDFGAIAHDVYYNVAADTATSIRVNLPDLSAAGANRSYRLDSTNTLTPLAEDLKMVASVLINGVPATFDVSLTMHY